MKKKPLRVRLKGYLDRLKRKITYRNKRWCFDESECSHPNCKCSECSYYQSKDTNSCEDMTYAEFKDWCNRRACDGQWSAGVAMTCIAIIEEIDSIKVKGLFKGKATKQARELAWEKYRGEAKIIY